MKSKQTIQELTEEIELALLEYSSVNPAELGEDKFDGHHDTPIATQALLTIFKDYVEQIIGDDEATTRNGLVGLTHKDETRNALKAEQRKKLKEML